MKKSVAVIGLGKFGSSLVIELAKQGVEVLAIDSNPEKVDLVSEYAVHAVVCKNFEEDTLRQIGVQNVDYAFVSFGDDIHTSVLLSLVLKEMEIPHVWAKASTDNHVKVLSKIGVDHIVQPERDMAKRVAHHIGSKKIIDYIELSKDFSIAEIKASEKLHNKTLIKLDIRAKYGCTIVAIHREQEVFVSPSPTMLIHEGDILIVIGRTEDINRFDKKGV